MNTSVPVSSQHVVIPEINNLLPALLNNLLHSFSENKSIHEVACDLCSTVLSGLRKYLDSEIADYCALFGYMDWLRILKLKGAAGFTPFGFHYTEIQLDEGFLGRVAARKRIAITRDLQTEKNLDWVDQFLAALSPHVAMLAMPMVLADGKLVGVFVIGKFYDDVNRLPIIFDKTIRKSIKSISKHITTIYYHAIKVVKGQLAKKYVDNERKILATAKRFYIGSNPNKDPIKFMEMVAKECLKLLNAGNSDNPFYKNFLFYEYQEYTNRFMLRSFGQPKYHYRNFALSSWIYKKYVQDGYVKSIESQNDYVTNRGKYPHVIRFIPEKVEQIIVELDATWSPAGLGCAFFVPLFDEDEKKPLGVLVFLSAKQKRRYIQQPEYFLGEEKRKSSLYHLKYFRSLQTFIAREYQKLQLEDRQRIVAKLENILTALKEVILLEDRTEVLDRLADFATKSLDCEACIIYLLDDSKSYLECVAFAGVQAQNELKISTTRFLKQNAQREAIIPLRILKTGQDIFAHSANQFRRLAAEDRHFQSLFTFLKSKRVISYLGQPIGNFGVIEVYNSSKRTYSGWSFFEEQDAFTLSHICDAIATVLDRIEATKSQVRAERMKMMTSLFLDISHELKNPLYNSVIFSRKLKAVLHNNALAKAHNGEASTLIDLIERNTAKAQNILRGMQSYQNIVTTMQFKPVDVVEILRTVIQTNQPACLQHHIELDTHLAFSKQIVYGDQTRLNQVFTNLLTNAIEAMPDGGVLSVKIAELQKEIQIEIADTGEGISENIQGRIFDPFFSTKKPEGSQGIGLSLGRWIIMQHNGKLEFKSKSSKGTCFTITLPKVQPDDMQATVVEQTWPYSI